MAGVDHDAQLVHGLHRGRPERRQPGVGALDTPSAHTRHRVVSELAHAHTEVVVHAEGVEVAPWSGEDLSVDQPRMFAFRLGPADIGRGARLDQPVEVIELQLRKAEGGVPGPLQREFDLTIPAGNAGLVPVLLYRIELRLDRQANRRLDALEQTAEYVLVRLHPGPQLLIRFIVVNAIADGPLKEGVDDHRIRMNPTCALLLLFVEAEVEGPEPLVCRSGVGIRSQSRGHKSQHYEPGPEAEAPFGWGRAGLIRRLSDGLDSPPRDGGHLVAATDVLK